MIISFEIENWMAFRDITQLTMVASKERQHNQRVVRIPKYPIRILPVTSIYGGNASGKSIFLKALGFAQNFIINGLKPEEKIPVEPYRLNPDYRNKPTKFRFELLIDEQIYEYSFSVTRNTVLEEKLVKITSSTEKELFYRQSVESIEFHKALPKQDYLNFAFHGTHKNQLFLTNSVLQKITTFKPVFDWFKSKLLLIGPSGLSGPFTSYIHGKDSSLKTINNSLHNFDTGILHLEGEVIPLDTLKIDEASLDQLKRSVSEDSIVEIMNPDRTERITLYEENDQIVAKRLVSYHRQSDGSKVKFEMVDESDGTRRLIDLLPGFQSMSSEKPDRVLVIDELDRSLHSMLTRQLINNFLHNCNNNTRSQLLFTTHDLLLMDQNIFRRDEMWMMERDHEGVSRMVSFAEFKDVRSDKDIRKSYLQGRLGGVPKILIDQCLIMNGLEAR